ncbi:MAG: EAL domain-containing protein [Actinobacteria bacterium]|nr:EAL domain-containing protein [Actinomycetota bacterium]
MAIDGPLSPSLAADDVTPPRDGRMLAAFSCAPVGMAIIAPDGTWLAANPALSALFGETAERLCEASRPRLTHPDEMTLGEELVAAVLAAYPAPFAADIRCIDRDGRRIWAHITAATTSATLDPQSQVIVQFHDVSERHELRDELAALVDRDRLTGLLNRTGFERELERHLRTVQRYGPEGALIVFDVDGFTTLNATIGEVAADRVLAAVGHVIRSGLRGTDTVGRLGGDRIAVLLPRADEREASRCAEYLLSAIAQRETDDLPGRSVSACAGVAIVDRGGLAVDQLMAEAESALADAKDSGPGRLTLATARDRVNPVRRRGRSDVANRVRAAIRDQRFELHAQPVVEIDSGAVVRHELLVRLSDSEGGTFPPAAFLDVADRIDLLRRVDSWVLSRAVALAAERSGESARVLSVNISYRSLADPGFISEIARLSASAGLPAGRLWFEMSQPSALVDIPVARRVAARLRSLGFRIALDDVGAGAGSFADLRRVPFDELKIDGSLTHGCGESLTDRLIVEAIVRVARGLGCTTVAEHVADAQAVPLLGRLGVDRAQGFAVGRPRPVAEVFPGAEAPPAGR